ncbi:uncharacterized protein N7498_008149 [Penicillium cinerascens]|uniref:Uncharacterized protein n=1 Tax=Penicillium cinerascens TaxID=70096 RepID=A0A9W9M9F1_9EURO|nr:uncharacterized protein N7498_008149 [Penicillium cinerascens]KAJ5194711.1 hypothetical protein N7498_008149 [Penicillium cinerascens]
MSSTSFKSPSTTTSTTSVAITPWVQRGSCASLWETELTSTSTNGSYETMTILASNMADPRFSSCQPSGDWNYYNMEATSTLFQLPEYGTLWLEEQISTAYCCASGFHLWTEKSKFPVSSLADGACVRSVNGDTPTTISLVPASITEPVPVITSGILAHRAWAITWAATDTPYMSPSLPTLKSSMLVPTWTPGEIIPDGKYDHLGIQPHTEHKLIYVAIIVPSIIGGSLFVCMLLSCVRWNKKRKKRAEERGDGSGTEGNDARKFDEKEVQISGENIQ